MTPASTSTLKRMTLSSLLATLMSAALLLPTAAVAQANSIDAVLAGAHRSEANKARDKFRNPKETLAFFGVTPESTVVEIWPGAGWYMQVLSLYLRDKGTYVAAIPANSERGMKSMQDRIAGSPELYNKTKVVPFGGPSRVEITPAGSADFVLTFRNVHNWLDDDNADVFMKFFYDALKPGGVLGVVEHRAKPGTKMSGMINSGYVTEDYVIKQALKVGFKLDAKSEINANAKDTKDYKKGVWTLPPVLTEGEADRAKYLEIGESDRMTLRFVKPTK